MIHFSLVYLIVASILVHAADVVQFKSGSSVNNRIIKRDFQVSEATGRSSYSEPRVTWSPYGRFVIAFDQRIGAKYLTDIEHNLFFQLFDSSGEVLNNLTQINEPNEFEYWDEPLYPTLSANRDGGFVIAWRQIKMTSNDLYARIFDASGIPVSDEIRINERRNSVHWYIDEVVDIVTDGHGNFIVVWIDNRNGQSTAFGQRFDSEGKRQGQNFSVDVEDFHEHYQPSVAMNKAGEFAIVWQEPRWQNGIWTSNVCAQSFHADGRKASGRIWIPPDDDQENSKPVLAITNKSQILVAWHSSGTKVSEIQVQQFDLSGGSIGNRIRIGQSVAAQARPSIAVNEHDIVCIAWQEVKEGGFGIYFAQYAPVSIPDRQPPFGVQKVAGPGYLMNPRLFVDEADNFFIAWKEVVNNSYIINAGTIIAESLVRRVKFPALALKKYDRYRHPVLRVQPGGGFVVTWLDDRYIDARESVNIYAQRYDRAGNPLAENRIVNDGSGAHPKQHPDMDMDAAGNFVVVWQEDRYGYIDIYGQRFNLRGKSQRWNFRINDEKGDYYRGNPCVGLDAAGHFVVAWEDDCASHREIYAQRYDPCGVKEGSNFKVSRGAFGERHTHPSISMDGQGNFAVVWQSIRGDQSDIFARIFSSSGEAMGEPFKVDAHSESDWACRPSVSMDKDGHFIITWQDSSADFSDIYAQRFHSTGEPFGDIFKVNDPAMSCYAGAPCVSLDQEQNAVITWHDNDGTRSVIMGQCCDRSGQPIGSNFEVNRYSSSSWRFGPSVCLRNGKIYTAWEVNHIPGRDWGIYANILTFIPDRSSADDQISSLLQSYPNPFNTSTKIHFRISRAEHVILEIYNAQGQFVRCLIHSVKPAGYHTATWDGRDDLGRRAASGLYFYKFKAGHSERIHKGLLLK